MDIDINCDMGESFGLYRIGDDEGLMPYITEANIACGFHASDPNHMKQTVDLAKRHGVKIGAHFSLPDLPGFGRREMTIGRDELANIITYQVGALCGFLNQAGVKLNHFKPHGALYAMAARDEDVAEAVADVAVAYDVSILGLAGTLHEEIYTARGLEFRSEFYADLEFDDEGRIIITREHHAVDPAKAAARCLRAVETGKATSVNGREISVRADSICVHSDTPNAVDIAKAVRTTLEGGTAASGSAA